MAKYLGAESQKKLIATIESQYESVKELNPTALYRAVGVDRTNWYRWKTQEVRIPTNRAVDICNKLGMDISQFITDNDIDNDSVLRPFVKSETLIDQFKGYLRSGLKEPSNTVIVELAVLFQELLRKNDLNSELYIKRDATNCITQLVLRNDTGVAYLNIQFSIKYNSPYVSVSSVSSKDTVAEFFLGKNAFIDMLRVVLFIDKKIKNFNKEEIGALEIMGSKLIYKQK